MITRRLSDDSGAVAVLFALVFLVIVGISALAVDVGYWYTSKRQLQSAADAAALAGCQQLAQDAGAAAVQADVDDFAARNFTAPVDADSSRVVGTEIGSDYVKVTVETDADVFLSHWLLGSDTTLIRAQSVARVGWLAGATGAVPWGLNIIQIDEMQASLGGQSTSLSENASGEWTGTFPAGASGPLVIEATNGQDYTEEFDGLVSVGALMPGGRITSIDTNKTTFTSGVDSYVHVAVTLASPLETGGGNKVTAGTGGSAVTLTKITDTLYEGNVSVPGTSDPFKVVTLEVSVKEGSNTESVDCGLLIRRANYILQSVEVDPPAVGSSDSVTVRIKPLEFQYGVQYQLKIEGGSGTTGNYQALDFATLSHAECGYPTVTPGGQSGGADYKENIIGDTGINLHLNDLVTTLPGNKLGPTGQGVTERLAGAPILTFAEWEAAGRPDTKQLCIIPICEKTEDQLGRAVLRIVSFATFFLEVPPAGQDPVIGRFIEWTAPGWQVTPNPPNNMAIQAIHLDEENLDF